MKPLKLTDLLIPVEKGTATRVFKGNYLYYDASIHYFKSEHYIYACCALLVVSVVIIFPLVLLLLYPM